MEISTRNGWFVQEFQDRTVLGYTRFGIVFSARRNNTLYAVKKTDCPTIEGRDFAAREVDALRQLRHRHIVAFEDAWLEDSEAPGSVVLFLQMELCETNTLRHHFNSKTFVSSRSEGLNVFKQIASAVEFIHEGDFVHCNLEPWNILFELGGHSVVKVGNFSFVSRKDQTNLPAIGRPRGIFAPLYMCPEQAHTNPTAPTLKWDIYNMGLIFLEIVNPVNFDEERNEWIRMMKEAGNCMLPQRFNEVELHLERGLIQRLLSHDPSERPAASGIIEEIDEMIANVRA